MIEAKNVVKSFDGFRALDGLTMTVPHGSIYGLVGPNGAGKSTLLRHVTGVYRQDSGSVLIEGNPVYESPADKSGVASIRDELYYFLSASTRDMMRFPFQEGEGLHHHVEGGAPEPQFPNFRPEIVKFLCPGGKLQAPILMAVCVEIRQIHLNDVRLQFRIQGVHTDGPCVPKPPDHQQRRQQQRQVTLQSQLHNRLLSVVIPRSRFLFPVQQDRP